MTYLTNLRIYLITLINKNILIKDFEKKKWELVYLANFIPSLFDWLFT